MKVVIVGDGKVGGTIARQLSGEGHDIIVIDNNTSVLNNASNTMDIRGTAQACLSRKEQVCLRQIC